MNEGENQVNHLENAKSNLNSTDPSNVSFAAPAEKAAPTEPGSTHQENQASSPVDAFPDSADDAGFATLAKEDSRPLAQRFEENRSRQSRKRKSGRKSSRKSRLSITRTSGRRLSQTAEGEGGIPTGCSCAFLTNAFFATASFLCFVLLLYGPGSPGQKNWHGNTTSIPRGGVAGQLGWVHLASFSICTTRT
jgi:hypothetical protein